ncbi:MAG TPA: trehalose-6-phosphate synthase [Gaiellales bacterium]
MGATASRRLIVASNRGPIVFGHADDGSRTTRRGGGGLVTALSGLVSSHDVSWIASAVTEGDREVALERDTSFEEHDRAGNAFRLRLLAHDPLDYDRYYNVLANPLLWFVQHELWPTGLAPDVDHGTWEAWEAYRRVNSAFAHAVIAEADAAGGDVTVMLHDYQLYLIGAEVRAARPDIVMTHFVHIPWPGRGAWRVLPTELREAIGRSLLACDVVGLHVEEYVREFLAFCEALPGTTVDWTRCAVHADGRETLVRAYPISVDADEFDGLAASPAVREAEQTLLADRPERLILRVDRTDPSKNIVRGLKAFDRLLEEHAEWRGRVRFLVLLDPSRLEVPEYADYLAAIQRAARSIGERWAAADGTPAIDLRIHDNFPEAVAAYRQYDVLLVNALADGMNLIAKEAPLVNARDGVLVLSETVGAHAELGPHAISVNPFDIQGQADALARALAMPVEERAARSLALREQVREHDVRAWLTHQLDDLDALAARR